MKHLLALLLLALSSTTISAQVPDKPVSPSVLILMDRLDSDERKLGDWPQLSRYREDNQRLQASLAGEPRVVFMGDSITDGWGRGTDSSVFFPGKPYINRGISGQTTPQMLIRFRPDVIALKPKAVVILAGINDIAGNTGPSSLAMIEDNLTSMAELAQANGIKVVLASLLPINDYIYPDQSANHPYQKIRELNAWIEAYAQRKGHVYLNYYDALLDAKHVLKRELSGDGLHPNSAGYAVMMPLAQAAVDQALAR